MHASVETLERYVPRRLVGSLPGVGIASRESPLVVLVADLTGFSALSQRLSAEGARGAEKLGELLNQELGRIIDEVAREGGEVAAFAGDAIVALWEPSTTGFSRVEAACRCAARITTRPADSSGDAGQLAVKAAVGAGELPYARLGGHEGRFVLVVGGAEVVATAVACSRTPPGSVSLTPAAQAQLDAGAPSARAPEGMKPEPQPLDPAVFDALVPLPVLAAVRAGHHQWMAEFRRTTVAFFGFRGSDLDEPGAVEALQHAVQVVQEETARAGGFVSQCVCDEKATAVLVGWGVPGAAHEDDAVRAVRAARASALRLSAAGLDFGIGVATGKTFCGTRGNSLRAEYAMIGDSVILAARLMQLAHGGELLVDAATAQLASHRLEFDEGTDHVLKGKTSPVRVRRVLGECRSGPSSTGRICGRQREQELLRVWLGRPPTVGAPLVVLEGEAGIGKSRLVHDVLAANASEGNVVLAAAGDPGEVHTSYQAWRSALRQVLGVRAPDDGRARELGLGGDLAVLVHEALGFDAPDTPGTRQLRGPARIEATVEALTSVLAAGLGERPLVILAEDAHWFDEASWALLQSLRESIPARVVIAVMRPYDRDRLDPTAKAVLRAPDAQIHLSALQGEELRELVLSALDADDIAPELLDFIRTRSKGHPILASELGLALRRAGCISVAERDARLPAGAPVLDSIDLPDTVEGLVARRVEQLGPDETLVLKVASLLGAEFTAGDVHAVHPGHPPEDAIFRDLELLSGAQLLRSEGDDRYTFHHALTRGTVYSRMPYSQRRDLHRSVALFLEASLSADAALLVHHFHHAGDLEKTVLHGERAGERAMRLGGNREAADTYRLLLELSGPGTTSPAPPARRARWACHLGMALYGLGDLEGSHARLLEALSTLGVQVPSSNAGWVATLAWQALLQAVTFRQGSAAADSDERDTIALAAQRLGEEFLWRRRGLQMIACTLLSANNAARARATDGVARCYATLGFSLGMARLDRLGDLYFDKARAVAARHADDKGTVFIGYAHAVFQTGQGNWEAARRSIERAHQLVRDMNDPQEVEMVETTLAGVEFLTGDLAGSARRFEDVYRSGRRRANTQHEAWGLYGGARSLILLGEIERAEQQVLRALALYRDLPEPISELICHGLLAEVRLVRGDLAAAQRDAREATRRIREAAPSVFTEFSGHAAASRVALAAARRARSEGHAAWRAARRELGGVLRDLWIYSVVFPIGRPRLHLMRGLTSALDGNPKVAQRRIEKALRLALHLGMPCEQAMCHRELLLLPAAEPESQQEHLAALESLVAQTRAAEALLGVP